NRVTRNRIGTDGTSALGNTTGIRIDGGSTNNVIGGGGSARRNIISENDSGIAIEGPGASFNLVQGNYIGTNVIGSDNVLYGNGIGVLISDGATDNTIGGTKAKFRNVVSGNSDAG